MANTITLPRRFWNDRAQRELPMPKVIAWSKTGVLVDAADAALDDYFEDAKYYSDIVEMSGDRLLYAGLQASARATVKAIKAIRAVAAPASASETEGAPV